MLPDALDSKRLAVRPNGHHELVVRHICDGTLESVRRRDVDILGTRLGRREDCLAG